MSPAVRLRGVLRLVRLPNTLTAAADVIAGAALASAAPLDPMVLVAALGSALLYGGGVALNDVLDLEKDRKQHPDRPLPSGLLRRGTALALAVGLLAAGAATALGQAPLHQVLTLALVGSIVAYDAWPETWRLSGSLVMGACRSLNLLRGATLGFADPGGSAMIAAAGHLALIALVTFVSTTETDPAPGRRLRTAALLLALPYLLPFLVSPDLGSPRSFAPLALGLLLAGFVAIPSLVDPPRPAETVKRAVFTLVLLDALYALAAGHELAALGCAALLPIIRLLARAIRQRGS